MKISYKTMSERDAADFVNSLAGSYLSKINKLKKEIAGKEKELKTLQIQMEMLYHRQNMNQVEGTWETKSKMR